MKNQTSSFLSLCAGLILVSAFSVPALAHHHGHKAFQECETAAGVAQGTDRSQFTAEQQASIHSCMQQKFAAKHAAMAACMSDKKVAMPDFQPGQRPNLDPVTKAALHACHKEIRAAKNAATPTPASVGSSN